MPALPRHRRSLPAACALGLALALGCAAPLVAADGASAATVVYDGVREARPSSSSTSDSLDVYVHDAHVTHLLIGDRAGEALFVFRISPGWNRISLQEWSAYPAGRWITPARGWREDQGQASHAIHVTSGKHLHFSGGSASCANC